jgi:hypothetical protein
MVAIAMPVAFVVSFTTSLQAASANGTRVPRDSATLTDSLGHVWRLAANAACPTGYQEILRDNGRPVTAYVSCGAVILYFNNAVSIQGDDNRWYGWNESGRTWTFLGGTAPDGNAPPPSPTPTPPPTAPPPSTSLPTPWVDVDIGSPARVGSASYSSGQFTINASGNDIWNNSDQFHYVYQPLAGDGQIQARVMSLSATDAWAKAAVMIRSSLAANSAHAMMIATPGNGVSLQYRQVAGQGSNYNQGPLQAIPVWVRLVRVGSTFTGSISTNGTTWTTVASQTVTMPTNVFVGLAVTSHNTGATTTAIISDVTVGAPSATTPPPPTTPTPTLSPKLVFTPSSDDSTNVTSYSVDIFTVGSNPTTATPAKSQNVGKPTITNGDMVVDLMPIITSLSSGSYFCTVTAIGPGGSTRSGASNTFAK